MARSRLVSVREKKEFRQAVVLILITIVLLIGFVFWGLPALARFVGNNLIRSGDSNTNSVIQIKPMTPILSDVPEAVNSSTLDIEGFAQPGVTATLIVNGESGNKVAVNDSGTFVFTAVKLRDGENRISAYVKNTTTNVESEVSKEYIVTVDTKAPELVVTKPESGKTFYREAERVVSIEGKVDESGTKVLVGERVAILSPDLSFAISHQLVEGDQEVVIKAVDKAGNESEISLSLRWEN